MGAGASKGLAKTHGPLSPKEAESAKGSKELGSVAAVHRTSSSRASVDSAGNAGTGKNGGGFPADIPTGKHKVSSFAVDGAIAANPLGEEEVGPANPGDGDVSFAPLDAVLGEPGSNAKYVKKRPIGKGAYGEAYIVERNASYDPASCPLAERYVKNNQLAHPARVGGTYVIKVMDLRSMRPQDRQYTQTEIICIAHTHHFAIIKYYEHYILDSGGETMVIVTEFADHGDLARNLNRARNALLLPEISPAAAVAGTSNSISSTGAAGHSAQSHNSNSALQIGSPKSQSFLSQQPQQPLPALKLTEREAGMYFVQLLAALHHIHKRRMIHRDVKTANLFLNSRGFIKLGDFGFSQKYESTVSSETIAGTFLGTPYYVSPEMWKGTRYGKKADVWAAGVVLYEMLMDGQRPFEAMGLTDLKRVVLEHDFVLPEYPPGADPSSPGPTVPEHSGVTTGDPAQAGAVTAKRPKFSPEIRELVQLIFQKDPKKRPSTEELLSTPIMQHYLFLFQRHVQSLIAEDAALLAANPNTAPSGLSFPDEEDRTLVLEGLEDLNRVIKQEIQKDMEDSGTLRYEGVVYKGNHDGSWKERYLALENDVLIISLSHAKSAVEGAERSRKVPLKLVKAVNMCQASDPYVQQSDGGRRASGGYVPPYSFVIFMQESSNPIYFGVATAESLDNWMRVFMRALSID